MAFKDILVHVDGTTAGKKRAEFAVQFAQHHEAHLAGVAFAATSLIPYYGEPGVIPPMPPSYFDKLREETGAALNDLKSRAEQAGVGTETRLFEGIPADFPRQLTLSARHADLAILGQPEEGERWSVRGELIGNLLFSAGRPVLVVPYIGAKIAVPETVIVAWDGSAQATRAMHDAMPLLMAAKKVIIFIANPENRPGYHGEEPGADIARHLARHGVRADVHREHGGDIDVGNLLLSRVADEDADLVVMGAYHHTRLREALVGGVTRTVLDHMIAPVFMAH